MTDSGAAGREQRHHGDFQFEIYERGVLGEVPRVPVAAEELRERAREALTPEAYGYVAGSAGLERTADANVRAFERWQIVPRMLNDVSARDTATAVLGTQMVAPFMLAPVGVQSIVHPEAELAAARAAAAHGVPFILSTASSHTIEDVAAAIGGGARWYQLYWPRDRDLAASFLERADAAGYEAVVVTLDTWLLGWRPRDLSSAYLPFLKAEGVANYLSDPVFRAALAAPPEQDMRAAIRHWAYQFANPTVTWDDLTWLREHTQLPVVLKGILHPSDARRALDAGVDALLVSNHGGRQVDNSIAALDALAPVREAVGDSLPVLFDSGIRSGADAFVALALGADAVCLGRPFVWGLALDGQAGVEHVIRCMLAEFDLTLALSGYTSVDQIERAAVSERPLAR
jgi:isopentenyl diphosphate isomerase/L-lactate dehydrogenase-like FMN-dependent dehydrogenase